MNKRLQRVLSSALAVIMLFSCIMAVNVNSVWAAETNALVLHVGADSEYKTINSALDVIANGGYDSYEVYIAPGVYEEQVTVDAANVSFIKEGTGDVVIRWYYGIDYLYYSCNADGVYDKTSAEQTAVKNEPTERWGAAVRINGSNFYAEGITFENTFNRSVSDKELADGVENNTSNDYANTTADRTAQGFDPKAKASTERAAALALMGVTAELKDCKILSSQDTLYLYQGTYYFNGCTVQGQTDYIFGDKSNAVFDSCKLVWAGYSTGATAGYITAARGNMLFRNCEISTANDLGNTVVPGFLGRHWADGAKVIFADTKGMNANTLVSSGASGQTAYFMDPSGLTKTAASNASEFYCTTNAVYSGTAVEATEITEQTGTNSTALTAEDVLGTTYLGSFIPKNYPFDTSSFPVISEYFLNDTKYGPDQGTAVTINDGVLALDNAKWNDAQHGVVVNGNTAMTINVDGAKTILLGACYFSNSGSLTVTDSEGNTVQTIANTKTTDCYPNEYLTIEYPTDKATTLTFKFSATTYIPYIKVSDYVAVNKYTVTGSVIDENGQVLTDASVTANKGDLTADKGVYTVANIPEGTSLKINASCTGYKAAAYETVVNGNITGADITLEKEADDGKIRPTWDFKNLVPSTISDVNIQNQGQNKEGTVPSNIEGYELYVDARCTDGKLAYNGAGYAQFNSGTIIRVPVKAEGDTVNVVAYPGQYKYTIGGIAAAANDETHTATAAEAAQGYVEIVATGGAYIYSIQLTTAKPSEPVDPTAPVTWKFGESNGCSSMTIENNTGYIDDSGVLYDTLEGAYSKNVYVDATAGKLSNAGRGDVWAQFNAGAIIYVPATAGAKVSVTAYGGTGYTIGAEAFTTSNTDYVVKSDDIVTFNGNSYVKVTATSNGYIDSITVTPSAEQPVDPVEPATPVTWKFGVSNGCSSITIQSNTGYIDDSGVFYDTLEGAYSKNVYVDATNGKLDNSKRTDNWAQFNTGTIIYVPATAGAKVSVTAYNGTEYTIGTDAFTTSNTDYVVKSEDVTELNGNSYVKVTAASNGYIDSISVTPFVASNVFMLDKVYSGANKVYVVGFVNAADISSADKVGFGAGKSAETALASAKAEADRWLDTSTVAESVAEGDSTVRAAESGKYFAAFTLEGDSDTQTGAVFYVVPFTTFGGETIYGSAEKCSYNPQ